MTDYDLWISNNPLEKEDEINRANFDFWLNTEDNLEELAGYLGWESIDVLNEVEKERSKRLR